MKVLPSNPWLASCKTFFLECSQKDIFLMAYSPEVNKFIFFEHCISHGLVNNCRVLYVYHATNLITSFKKEIRNKQLMTYELRDGIEGLETILADLCLPVADAEPPIQIIFDFSHISNFEKILELLRRVKSSTASSSRITGVVAFNIECLDATQLGELSKMFSAFIFLTGEINMISFPISSDQHLGRDIIPVKIVDSVVRHSLEQLILMELDREVSGFDIIKKISERFHVEIPLSRVYSYLYSLEDTGLVTTQIRGRAKIYTPTEEGKKYIEERLRDFEAAHKYILGYHHG
jgi:predicted transcriptional regulator